MFTQKAQIFKDSRYIPKDSAVESAYLCSRNECRQISVAWALVSTKQENPISNSRWHQIDFAFDMESTIHYSLEQFLNWIIAFLSHAYNKYLIQLIILSAQDIALLLKNN